MILLIHPPVVKPSEPPPGIAKLAGALKFHGTDFTVLDANIEGLLGLFKELPSSDKWTKRASKNFAQNLSLLRDLRGYDSFDRYKRAVSDLTRLADIRGKSSGIKCGLGNYEDRNLSPVKSKDLIKASLYPENNLFYPYFKDRLREIINFKKPSIIGFSLNYLSQGLSTFAMAGFIRKHFPEIKLILGGGLITSWVRRPDWKNPFEGLIDYIIDGPGEDQLLSIAGKNIKEKNHYTPEYNMFPLDKYLSPGFILPYSTSTGCYWNKCSFCPEKAEKNPYTGIPAKEVIKDINVLINKKKPLLIHFLDNALSPGLMREFIKNPFTVPWYGFTRFTEELADIDFSMELKKSGCIMLKLGLESGDQHVLDKMNKHIDLNMASKILKNLKKTGIATYIYLLFGTPGEDISSAGKTLNFIIGHHNEISFLNLAIFNLPVYSPDAIMVKTKDFYYGDMSLYKDFIHPVGWNRKEVRHFLEKEFKIHKAVSPIVKRNPPVFTSNHAPFFIKGGIINGNPHT